MRRCHRFQKTATYSGGSWSEAHSNSSPPPRQVQSSKFKVQREKESWAPTRSWSWQAVEKLPRAAPQNDWPGWRGVNDENMKRTYLTNERQSQTGQATAARRVAAILRLPRRCSSVADPCGYAPSSRLAESRKPTHNAACASFPTACCGDPWFPNFKEQACRINRPARAIHLRQGFHLRQGYGGQVGGQARPAKGNIAL